MNVFFLLVLAAVCLTGHRAFVVRERATAWLVRHGGLALPALDAGRRQGCEETIQRCQWVSFQWRQRNLDLAVELYRPSWGYFPWVYGTYDDCLIPNAKLMQKYLEEALKTHPAISPEWEAYSEATRLWVRDRIEQGQPVDELLRVLILGHKRWCADHGYQVPP